MERVTGMPVRAIITKEVIDLKWTKGIFPAGWVSDWDEFDFELFKSQHPDCIVEIEMTEDDWINLATDNAKKAKVRIWELEKLYGEKFSSNYIGVIPISRFSKVDGHGYCDRLSDAYKKTIQLLKDVEEFEEQCIENMIINESSQEIKVDNVSNSNDDEVYGFKI